VGNRRRTPNTTHRLAPVCQNLSFADAGRCSLGHERWRQMQPGEDDPCRTITPVPTGGSPLLRDNGRTLTDEASDAFLAILTNRKVAEDKVGPHRDLLAKFPYLGSPLSGVRVVFRSAPVRPDQARDFVRLGRDPDKARAFPRICLVQSPCWFPLTLDASVKFRDRSTLDARNASFELRTE
jgi:hypothetical protein